MPQTTNSMLRSGLYIDVANLAANGGYGMQFGILRDFICRDGAEPLRLNAYVSFDPKRAEEDGGYKFRQRSFHAALREQGFKVIEKHVKWYKDEQGNMIPKANADLDLAVDALLQSQNLDCVTIGTGDGDFVQVVRALQNRGCRVEIVAFDHVSNDLRREADLFVSGYLIPGLLPIQNARRDERWGDHNSVVRGVCYHWPPDKPFGFFKYLKSIGPDLWKTDTRRDDTAYGNVFCHESELPRDLHRDDFPSRDIVLEFRLLEEERDGKTSYRAVEVEWVNRQ